MELRNQILKIKKYRMSHPLTSYTLTTTAPGGYSTELYRGWLHPKVHPLSVFMPFLLRVNGELSVALTCLQIHVRLKAKLQNAAIEKKKR